MAYRKLLRRMADDRADAFARENSREIQRPLENRLDGLDLPAELQDLVSLRLVEEPSTSQAGGGAAIRDRTISHEALVKVSQWARKQTNGRSSCSLASLLALTDVYAPPLPVREKSPELLAILAKIRLDQERAAYDAMTSTAPIASFRSLLPMDDKYDPARTGRPSEAEDWQLVRKQVSAIVNVLASMAAVGTGVWWVGGGRTHAARLVLSLTGAVMIGVIEAFLYYRFFTRKEAKIDAGRTKTRPLRFEKGSIDKALKAE